MTPAAVYTAQLQFWEGGRPKRFRASSDPSKDHAYRVSVINEEHELVTHMASQLGPYRGHAASDRPPSKLSMNDIRYDQENMRRVFEMFEGVSTRVSDDPFGGGPAVSVGGKSFPSHHASAAYGLSLNWQDLCFWVGDGPPDWEPFWDDTDALGVPWGTNFVHVSAVAWPERRWNESRKLFPGYPIDWATAWGRVRAANRPTCPPGMPEVAWRLMRGWSGRSAPVPDNVTLRVEVQQAIRRSEQLLASRLSLSDEPAPTPRPPAQPHPNGTVHGSCMWFDGKPLILSGQHAQLAGFIVSKTEERELEGRGEPGVHLDEIRRHLGWSEAAADNRFTNLITKTNNSLFKVCRQTGFTILIQRCGHRRKHAVIQRRVCQ